MNKLMLVLIIIGALNWGCIGIFSFDVLSFLLGGETSVLSHILYTIVGIAGLWSISFLFRSEQTRS